MKIIWFCLLSVLLAVKLTRQQDDFYDDSFQSSDVSVKKFWGIQSATTSVGMLFNYKIPADAFKGSIMYYEVSGENEKSLPKWMLFDKKLAVLEGVPSEDDIGDTQINVKAYDNKGNFVSDMFVVEVFPLLEKNTNDKRKCKKGEDVMMVEIIIERNLNQISPLHKIEVLKNISRYLEIPVNTVLLLSQKLNADYSSNHYENTDNYYSNTSVLTWQIGCNDRIWAEKLKVVKAVDKHMIDNKLVEAIQLPLFHWRLVSSFNPFRKRRHIIANSTATSDQKNSDTLDDLDDDNEEEFMDENNDDENENDDDFSESSPPVPPEYSSLSIKTSEDFHPTPVENKSIINTDEVNQTLNKSYFDEKVQPKQQDSSLNEDSTETADDLDEENSKLNETNYNFNSTPDLSSILSLVNTTVISVSPITTPKEIEKTTVKTKHYPPQVFQNIEAWTVVAGKPYKKLIPENVFIDEDGNTSNLTLKLIKSEEFSPCTSWIEFNSEKREVHMLPSLDAISNHEFTIEAIDSDGMSVNTTLVIAVQYPQNTRKINFEISLHMKLPENQNVTVGLQFNILDRIAALYGDADSSKITVRNVSCSPFILTWTNDSLPLEYCDNKTISTLLQVLTDSERSMNVNRKVQQEIESLVTIEKVTWRSFGLCANEIPLPLPPQPPKQNFIPIIHDRIDNLTARVGELKVYKVPENAFYDADVRSTRDLKLTLWTIDHTPVSSDNWLQLDTINQELYGIPMNGDVGSARYQLECEDNINKGDEWKERQVIEVIVESASKRPYNVEFSMTLTSSYEQFNKSPLMRRTFVEKLATLFGDKNTSAVVISGYAPGSVIITWHNRSLSVDRCQETEIEQLRRVLLNDEGKLNEEVNKVLGVEFEVISAQVTPIGICEGSLTEFYSTESNAGSQEIPSIIFSSSIPNYIREYFFEIILPVTIIVIMVFFATIVACVLYKRQRSAKWTLGDGDERRSYRNKGIPVIFQDELEERLEPTNKSPIIMKEEKPPLPPPEYQKTLPLATTALLSDFDDSSYQQGSMASFTPRSKDRNGRSKGTPLYRKPPPYAPP